MITTPTGKESWGEVEVGNSILPEDPDVKITKTVFPGVLLVYTVALDSFHAYRLVLSSEPAFILRVVPILDCVSTRTSKDIISRIDTLLDTFARHLKEACIEMTLRSSSIGEKEIQKIIEEVFRQRGIRFSSKAAVVLKIESVCNCYLFSIIRRGSDRARKTVLVW